MRARRPMGDEEVVGQRARGGSSWRRPAATNAELVEAHGEHFLLRIYAADGAEQTDLPASLERLQLRLQGLDAVCELLVWDHIVLHHNNTRNLLRHHLLPNAQMAGEATHHPRRAEVPRPPGGFRLELLLGEGLAVGRGPPYRFDGLLGELLATLLPTVGAAIEVDHPDWRHVALLPHRRRLCNGSLRPALRQHGPPAPTSRRSPRARGPMRQAWKTRRTTAPLAAQRPRPEKGQGC
mmetsp:Transcript_80872/g.203414  ORF Transcript_80872/g.203414 Transcript_80872/m.203414 type:complete len:237 (-) Transcript_80872:318-1028(-)